MIICVVRYDEGDIMGRKLLRILCYIILICLSIILVISLKNIIEWFNDNRETKEIVEKIVKNTNIIAVEEDKRLMYVDLNDLKKINNDTVAYIKVNNTNIDYPVVKTTNNTFYLDHSFDKSYNKAGWVFMDYRNNVDYYDTNTILYAHGRLDNTMFGSLREVIKDSWYMNKENHIIKYSNDKSSSLWQVFSIYKIKETDDYLDIDFSTKDSNLKFINMIKSRSIYDFNCDVNVGDKILTLSSCYNDTDRVVLHAKLIKYVEK